MNDDFLHRLREEPSPEFLARLKARLDGAPRPGTPRQLAVRPQRFSFVRGLITGLLLGGAVVAIAAATLNGVPEPVRALVRAPVRLLARMLPESRSDDQESAPDHHGVVPLGPAWFPTHAASQAGGPKVDGAPVALDGSAHSSAPTGSASTQDAQTGGPITWSENLTIYASFSTASTLAQAAVYRNHYPGARFKLEPAYGEDFAFAALCREQPYGAPEIIEVSRRMSAEESRACSRVGLGDIIEVKIAYQAIALARAKLSGPLRLSSRDLFLGLAHRVPDLNRPLRFAINPNTTWNQVDPALPHEAILVFGPLLNSGAGRLVQDLLLEPGCNTYQWIATLRDLDPAEYESVCRNLRADNTYQVDMSVGRFARAADVYTDRLIGSPTAIGIYSLNELEQVKDKLLAIPIDGVDPTVANITNGTYPLSHALYIYAVKRRVQGTHIFGMFVRYNIAAATDMSNGNVWGLLPPPDDERTATLANVDALKESSK